MTCNLFTMHVYLKLLGFRCTFGKLVYQLLQVDLNTSWKAYIGSLGVVPHSGLSEQTPSQLKHPNVNYGLILFSNDLFHSPQQYHQPILKSRPVNGIYSKNKAFFVQVLSWKAEMSANLCFWGSKLQARQYEKIKYKLHGAEKIILLQYCRSPQFPCICPEQGAIS